MQNKEIILKIIHTKNNTFLTFLDLNHNLLYKQSLGTKITQDFKATLLSKITTGLAKINDLNQTEESTVTVAKITDLNQTEESTVAKITDLNQTQESRVAINLYLYLNNFPKIYISDLLNLFILWKINLCYCSFDIKLPHNGCRYPHKSRKKKQQHKQLLKGAEFEKD